MKRAVFVLFGMLICCGTFSTGVRAQGACCSITAIDAASGVVSAKVNANGETFQFRFTNANLLRGLRVGQGVYANFTTHQISLDGKTIAGPITSGPQAPAPTTAAPPAPPKSVPVTPSAAPADACCNITGINATSGQVTARVNATGQTFTFTASTSVLNSLKIGQGIYANLGTKQISIDGKSIAGSILNLGAAPSSASSGGSSTGGSTTSTQNCGNGCNASQTCSGGSCVCRPGLTNCGSSNSCTELSADSNNCGACGRACGLRQICSAGACVAKGTPACPAGQTLCGNTGAGGGGGGCYNTLSDPLHCGLVGTCGVACASNQTCSNGQCLTTSAAGNASTPATSSAALGPAQGIELGAAPVRGSRHAPVLIIEFADYQCPFCQQMEPRLKKLQDEFGNNIALAFKDFPLSMHPYAEKAAEAARCARKQGRFWDFNNVLFNSSNLEGDQMKQYARLLGLNPKSFNRCLDSGREAVGVQADLAQGHRLGIDGTPNFFINGHSFSGAVDYETLRGLVEQQLRSAMPRAVLSAANSR